MKLGVLMASDKKSLDPRKFPNDEFELFSIPAYDEGKPERILGSEIGSSKQILQPNDVLISRIVPHIRRAWVVPESNGLVQIGSSEWIIFRANDFYPGYLRHYLLSDQFNAQFMSTVAGVGGSLLRARPAAVAQLHVSLPQFDEQKRIGYILEKVEEIANDVGNFTSREEYFIRSIFNHMFGDVMNNEKNWKQDSLGEHMNLINGRAYSKNELLGEGTPIIRIQNLKGGQRWYYSDLELPDSKYCENGDLLFAWSATFGPFQWKGARSIYHYHIWKIELESTINKEFAFWLLDALTLSIKNQSHGASMLHYGKGKMELLQIPVPPIQLQTQFSEIVSYIRNMKLTQNLDRIIELKKSTIQEMLT